MSNLSTIKLVRICLYLSRGGPRFSSSGNGTAGAKVSNYPLSVIHYPPLAKERPPNGVLFRKKLGPPRDRHRQILTDFMVDKLLIFVKNSSYTNFFFENSENNKTILGRGLFRIYGQLVNHKIGKDLCMAIPWWSKVSLQWQRRKKMRGGYLHRAVRGTR